MASNALRYFLASALGIACSVATAIDLAPYARGQSVSLSPGAKVRGHCSSLTVTQAPTIAYDPIVANFSAPATGTGHIYVTCTFNAVGTIDVDHGQHASQAGAYFAPNMAGTGTGPPLLSYFIYSSAPGSGLWGTTTSDDGGSTAGTTVAISGTGRAVDYPVYISIPPTQNVPADSYSDSVTVTVTF